MEEKTFFAKVAKFSEGRLIVEVPKNDAYSAFLPNDCVLVRKITPQEVSGA